MKSATRPLVGPLEPTVVIKHEMVSLTRTRVVNPDARPLQDRAEATVGEPTTANENGNPPLIRANDDANFSVMRNVPIVVDGDVRANENDAPALVVDRVVVPVPPVV